MRRPVVGMDAHPAGPPPRAAGKGQDVEHGPRPTEGRPRLERGAMPIYFTNIGPARRLYLHRDARGAAIGVLESPDHHMPIGMAMPRRWDDDGAVPEADRPRSRAPRAVDRRRPRVPAGCVKATYG